MRYPPPAIGSRNTVSCSGWQFLVYFYLDHSPNMELRVRGQGRYRGTPRLPLRHRIIQSVITKSSLSSGRPPPGCSRTHQSLCVCAIPCMVAFTAHTLQSNSRQAARSRLSALPSSWTSFGRMSSKEYFRRLSFSSSSATTKGLRCPSAENERRRKSNGMGIVFWSLIVKFIIICGSFVRSVKQVFLRSKVQPWLVMDFRSWMDLVVEIVFSVQRMDVRREFILSTVMVRLQYSTIKLFT